MIGRRGWVPWVWLSPALLLLAAFLVYPAIDTFRRSLMDARSRSFVGLDNYAWIVENPNPLVADTHAALLNTALWIVLFTGTIVPLGLVLAVLSGRVRYEAVAKSAVFIPMAISFVAASVIWRFMLEFNPAIGTVNAAVTSLGGEPTAWLQNTGAPQAWATAIGPDRIGPPLQLNNLVLIGVGVWMWTGFAMVVLSAGLNGIPAELLEAARVDGANEWQIFSRITVPLLRPVLVVVSTTLLINALKVFDLVWVMTGGRFQTDVVATQFFKMAFNNQNFGVGSALAVILLLAVVPLMSVSVRRFQAEEASA
ncbi:MAG: carbohydrate ABC transporter permease [Dehalococcoidia bacterium]